MKNIQRPFLALLFMRNNSVVVDTTHDLINPHLTMQVKNTASEMSAKLQVLPNNQSITVPPMTTKAITAFVHHPSEWNTIRNVTPIGKITAAESLLITLSMSTIFDKREQAQAPTHRSHRFQSRKPHNLLNSQ